jgi:hypothetical protein
MIMAKGIIAVAGCYRPAPVSPTPSERGQREDALERPADRGTPAAEPQSPGPTLLPFPDFADAL